MPTKRRLPKWVTEREDSPYLWYDFTIKGRGRFRGSTETDEPNAAGIIAAEKRKEILLSPILGTRKRMTLDVAFGRYWIEVAQHQPSSGNTKYQSAFLTEGMGGNLYLDDDLDDPLSRYIARRRAEVSDSSVNRETQLLRRVLRRAVNVWKVAVSMPKWDEHLLHEPDDVGHALTLDQEEALFKHLRPDFHPMFRFALASGQRLGNVIGLRWSQVSWEDRAIYFRVKSRKPGGKLHVVPISQAMAAILSAERGKHQDYVFTYLCHRRVRNRKRDLYMEKGARYPFSKNGWRKVYDDARTAINLPNLRFHDLRHTVGTRVTKKHGLRMAQRLLGHESLETTLRYAKSNVGDLRDAMDSTLPPTVSDTTRATHASESDVEQAAAKAQ